jgi:uncharacterized membrane protein YeaQ/YmgE (transglycosylase-associated protein family)
LLASLHGMWLLLCVFVGVAAAVTANYISGKRGVGLAFDAVLGITGAYVTGFVFNRLAGADGEAVSVAGLVVSVVGAAAILGVSWMLVGRDGPVF